MTPVPCKHNDNPESLCDRYKHAKVMCGVQNPKDCEEFEPRR